MNFAANHWDEIGHFYQPIALYQGAVLKYQGVATEGNKAWMLAKPGMVLIDDYLGDRIKTDTLEPFNG